MMAPQCNSLKLHNEYGTPGMVFNMRPHLHAKCPWTILVIISLSVHLDHEMFMLILLLKDHHNLFQSTVTGVSTIRVLHTTLLSVELLLLLYQETTSPEA